MVSNKTLSTVNVNKKDVEMARVMLRVKRQDGSKDGCAQMRARLDKLDEARRDHVWYEKHEAREDLDDLLLTEIQSSLWLSPEVGAMLLEMMSNMDEDERKMLCHLFGNDHMCDMGGTSEAVSYRVKKLLEKARKYL
jgi:hypothetical protein